MMKKGLAGVLIMGSVMAALTGCTKKGTDSSSAHYANTSETKSSKSSETGTFTVGFDQDFPPMGFMGDDGEFTGFDLELAAETAKRMGLTIKYQPIAWDSKDMELKSGTIDCIWNGFTMNGREEGYAWSEPYMENDQVFVVREDSGISKISDLSGKSVEVQADSSAEAALKDKPEITSSFLSYQAVPDYLTAMMDLESGATDAIAMDNVVASYQIKAAKKDFVILDDPITAEEYAVGFAKDNTKLRDEVQKTLDEIASDGTVKKISEKWFDKDITTIGKGQGEN